MTNTTKRPNPPATTAGKVAGALLLVVVGFQLAVAAGAPWGEAAFGGQQTGVLPAGLRVSSGVTAVVYLLLAAAAATRWTGATVRRRLLYGAAALMVVGALLNIASPSLIERLLWTPVTIALVLTLWQAARLTGPSAGMGSGRTA